MARVLLIVAAGLPFLAVGVGLGIWWAGRQLRPNAVSRSDREIDFEQRVVTLQHHADLLERARRAALDDEPGLANIYSEAAERVLKLTDPGD